MNDQSVPRPWTIGIHGSRRTGKTCYLASLYGFRALEDNAVSFDDDTTIDYLKNAWDGALVHGEVPQATSGLPTSLHCTMKAGRQTWRAALQDYSGELVERKSSAEPSLREETREWLGSCDAVLIFLDPGEEPDELRERLNELGLLLKELYVLSVDGGNIARPLGLILTKWDTQPGFTLASADPAAETERARALLQSHPVLGQFSSTLETAGDRVRLFPVSAFGAHRADNRPPTNGPRPFNLHAPLRWAFAGAEAMQVDGALRRAAGWVACPWPHYSRALRELDDILHGRALNDSDDRARLLVEKESLSARRGKRRRHIAKILTTFVLVTLCWYAWLDESDHYRWVNEVFGNLSQNSKTIRAEKDSYLSRKNPFMHLLGHGTQVRNHWDALQETLTKRDFANLDGFRERHAPEGEADARLREDGLFLTSWGNSPDAATVQGWEKDDFAVQKKHADRLAQEGQYQTLQNNIAAAVKKNRYDEAVDAYHQFLQGWPQSSYRLEIEQRIVELQSAADESSWREIVDFEAQNPNSYEQIVKLADEYAVKPGAKHGGSANELADRTRRRWDHAYYDRVVNANQQGNDTNAISSTFELANTYLNAPFSEKRMQDDVKRWVDWYNRLQQPGDYYVMVRSIQITHGSEFDPSLGNPTCRVEIILNGVSHMTNWEDGHNITFAQSLGPYHFQWGHRGELTVAIEGYHHAYWNDRAQSTQSDDTFMLRQLNGPTTIRCKDGSKIYINLECEQAVPPVLPVYR